MNRLDRPTALKIAAAISAFLALVELFVYDLPAYMSGAAAVDQIASTGEGPPFALLIVISIVSLVALLGAYGTWNGRRWGVALVVVCTVLMLFPSIMGILFAPQLSRIWGVTTILLQLVILVCCFWRRSKASVSPQAKSA
ncbi:hypothetical protein SE17_40600 [Kouleothrix aurantiaca]|uniref:Integral membrane protein n=1 Tax=Kouleothrix aurantiaca TaxID=186479 RepID=A0A0P9EUM6_9CHLR|nr:hypothetical protein SE17_40600 [Kouleothrix aurantiaca]